MKLRQFGSEDLTQNSKMLTPWLQAIADESKGAFSQSQLSNTIAVGPHLGFYYCTDALEIVGILIVTITYDAAARATMVMVGAAGSVMNDWDEAGELINELALTLGCKGMTIKGRRGLGRVFKHQGWTERYTEFYKDCHEPKHPVQLAGYGVAGG